MPAFAGMTIILQHLLVGKGTFTFLLRFQARSLGRKRVPRSATHTSCAEAAAYCIRP